MKVTTVRFAEDLWALLEAEAARTGVSVAQYIRDAALARAAFAAGARADAPADLLTRWARAAFDGHANEFERSNAAQKLIAALARSASEIQRDDARALHAESKQAVRQADQVVGRVERRRAQRRT